MTQGHHRIVPVLPHQVAQASVPPQAPAQVLLPQISPAQIAAAQQALNAGVVDQIVVYHPRTHQERLDAIAACANNPYAVLEEQLPREALAVLAADRANHYPAKEICVGGIGLGFNFIRACDTDGVDLSPSCKDPLRRYDDDTLGGENPGLIGLIEAY